jgi:hypothetical protein
MLGAMAQSSSGCSAYNPTEQDDFLACVATNVKRLQGETGVVFEDTLQQDLSKLSQTIGYVGQISDLDALKALSARLKRHPGENQDAITILDNAISAHKTELRSVISPTTLPIDPVLDQYSTFVRRKLKYLLSDATKFYDGGPFEIVTRSNLATALQEAYFLDKLFGIDEDPELKRTLAETAGADRTAWLSRAVAIFDDIIDRLTSAQHDYLPVSLRLHSVNDFRYRRATILLTLREKENYQQALKSLATANQDFSLSATEIDHVYVYKLFYTPYRLIIVSETDAIGRSTISPHIDDPYILKKLYNPAQLALVSCSVRNIDTVDAVSNLSQLVRNLALSDYYVVLASSNDRATLEKLQKGLQSALQVKPESRASVELRVKQLEVDGFSQAIKDGARECKIIDEISKKIFAPFVFETSLVQIEKFGKFKYHLTTGGRLNADQARSVASFVNSAPELQPILAPARAFVSAAYIARMKVGQ